MSIESFVSLPLLAAPAWIWATLMMAGFVALTALTMALARFAVKERPAPKQRSPRDDASEERSEASSR